MSSLLLKDVPDKASTSNLDSPDEFVSHPGDVNWVSCPEYLNNTLLQLGVGVNQSPQAKYIGLHLNRQNLGAFRHHDILLVEYPWIPRVSNFGIRMSTISAAVNPTVANRKLLLLVL